MFLTAKELSVVQAEEGIAHLCHVSPHNFTVCGDRGG